jgi:hypothetical protein
MTAGSSISGGLTFSAQDSRCTNGRETFNFTRITTGDPFGMAMGEAAAAATTTAATGLVPARESEGSKMGT